MNFFIGLTFDASSVHHSKILSFKKRFDQKFSFNPVLQLSLLPSFEVENTRQDYLFSLKNQLSEIIDDHMFGPNIQAQIEFNGIDFRQGKKAMIGLTMLENSDLLYLKESLYEFLKDEGAKFKKDKFESNELLLPIGRFDFQDSLNSAIEMAKVEFNSPFVLSAKSITLFEKNNYFWNINSELYSFQSNTNFNFVNNLWAN